MKKILTLLIITVLLVSVGCSRTVFYPEDESLHAWLSDKTEGYTRVALSSITVLHSSDTFRIQLSAGSTGVPTLSVTDNRRDATSTSTTLLKVVTATSDYGTATLSSIDFDPYLNTYLPGVRVYRKDDTHFRLIFTVYGDDTDFYPLPRLLTEEQYGKLLDLVKEYTESEAEQSDLYGETVIDYTADFLNLYTGAYTSNLVENPTGDLFYQLTGTSDYLGTYRKLLSSLNLTEQEWRRSFEKLGYVGYTPNRIALFADLTVEDDVVRIELDTEHIYQSRTATAAKNEYFFSFCAGMTEEFIVTTGTSGQK